MCLDVSVSFCLGIQFVLIHMTNIVRGCFTFSKCIVLMEENVTEKIGYCREPIPHCVPTAGLC